MANIFFLSIPRYGVVIMPKEHNHPFCCQKLTTFGINKALGFCPSYLFNNYNVGSFFDIKICILAKFRILKFRKLES